MSGRIVVLYEDRTVNAESAAHRLLLALVRDRLGVGPFVALGVDAHGCGGNAEVLRKAKAWGDRFSEPHRTFAIVDGDAIDAVVGAGPACHAARRDRWATVGGAAAKLVVLRQNMEQVVQAVTGTATVHKGEAFRSAALRPFVFDGTARARLRARPDPPAALRDLLYLADKVAVALENP